MIRMMWKLRDTEGPIATAILAADLIYHGKRGDTGGTAARSPAARLVQETKTNAEFLNPDGCKRQIGQVVDCIAGSPTTEPKEDYDDAEDDAQ